MSFIVRRLVFYIVAAWVALTVNFFIPRLMPGNAVEAIMAKFPNLQPSAYHALQAMLGVGHPGSIWHQYISYLDDVFHFNFGTDVITMVKAGRIEWSIALPMKPQCQPGTRPPEYPVPVGNQCSLTASRSTRSRARKKYGIACRKVSTGSARSSPPP